MNKLLIIILPIFSIAVSTTLFSTIDHKKEIVSLNAPIRLDNEGISSFFKTVFKDPNYGVDILPDSFFHLEQLLSYGYKSGQSIRFTRSALRLFTNKLKSSLYVNAYAAQELLEQLPKVLGPYASSDRIEDNGVKEEVVTLLYEEFFANFEQFKQDPDGFFSRLSNDIVKRVDTISHKTEPELTQLHSSLHLFLDLVFNRLIWDPTDEAKTWESVKALGNSLSILKDAHLIASPEVLDDLYNSIISRYCIFLDLMQGNLSVQCFVALKDAVSNETAPMLESSTEEEYALSRREQLLRTIHIGETQARAREYGYTKLEGPVTEPPQTKLVFDTKEKQSKRRKKRRARRKR